MRPKHPYQVRDREELKKRMRSSQRVVPHSVRSLAALVGVSRTTVGDLLTGKQARVTSEIAQRISVALGSPMDELFMPESSTTRDEDSIGGASNE